MQCVSVGPEQPSAHSTWHANEPGVDEVVVAVVVGGTIAAELAEAADAADARDAPDATEAAAAAAAASEANEDEAAAAEAKNALEADTWELSRTAVAEDALAAEAAFAASDNDAAA